MGLDIGTSHIVAARGPAQDFEYDIQLNAFVNVPYSKMTEKALTKERIPHSVEDGQIVIYGNESERFAELLDTEVRRPMRRGLLNADEPDNLKIIRQVAAAMAGRAASPGQPLCFTVPAALPGAEENLTYHEATLRQLLAEQGYAVKSINEGLAVVYAEMEDSNYTGIGVSCGAGLCNVCLAYLSVPVMSFAVPKAGDFIDASAASITGERANRIRLFKEESFYLNGQCSERIPQVLTVYYDDVIGSLVAALNNAFRGARTLPKISRPVPLVLSGGTAMPKGFCGRFEQALRASDFPLTVSEVRLASGPLTATARGALIAALTDVA
ncbi:MAG: hypothetical protein ACE15B_07090 [Bryobacteraceae bacterium]